MRAVPSCRRVDVEGSMTHHKDKPTNRVNRRQWLQAVAAAPLLSAIPLTASLAAAEAPAAELRQLRFTLTLNNPLAQRVSDQRLWAYMPMRRGTTQRLERLTVSQPHRVVHDALEQTLLCIDWADVPPMAVRVVNVQAEVRVRASPEAQALPRPAEWLTAERFIEVEDPAIQQLAASLKGSTDHATLDAIYDWVSRSLRYAGYLADSLGARHAVLQGSGDCTEYACLVVALARANGIAARLVGGYVASSSVAPRAQDYHDWAEVWLEGAWRPMDAQKQCWRRDAQDYVAFRVHRDPPVNVMGAAQRFLVEGQISARM